ncbi:MAG: MAPEG family protein [Polyangiaceae bacterium]
MTDVHLLLVAALLTWFSLMLASGLRSSTAGMQFNFGNRDEQPPLSPLAGRADRAAKNLLENLPLFIAVMVAARFAGASSDAIVPGAHVFVWARVLYLGVYLLGVPYLRTAVFGVSLLGIFMIATAALGIG